jgi:hypothetical protein
MYQSILSLIAPNTLPLGTLIWVGGGSLGLIVLIVIIVVILRG